MGDFLNFEQDGAVVTLHGDRDRHLLVAEDADVLAEMREDLRVSAPA